MIGREVVPSADSLLTELVIVMIVRTGRPFHRSRPGRFLVWLTVSVSGAAVAIPFVPFAGGEPADVVGNGTRSFAINHDVSSRFQGVAATAHRTADRDRRTR